MPEPRIGRREALRLWQAAVWPETAREAARALAGAAGAAAPERGRVAEGPGGALARVGPLKWWLIGGDDPALDPALGATLDLSCEQVAFDIEGPGAADLLARLTAVDLRDRAFPPGGFAATGGHQLMVKLWRRAPLDWTLFVMRSYADFAQGLVQDLTHNLRVRDA
jgi:sarcosine oxidase subunit gamma